MIVITKILDIRRNDGQGKRSLEARADAFSRLEERLMKTLTFNSSFTQISDSIINIASSRIVRKLYSNYYTVIVT